MKFRLQYHSSTKEQVVTLNGSKSISNRALIIRALCNEKFEIKNLSTAKDTDTLFTALSNAKDDSTLDVGAAGTSFRFLTAYLAIQEGTQILTGSPRMKQRPIGVLVDSLRELGAEIEYLEKEGFPPLKIHSYCAKPIKAISLSANISSQFISALMLIAPALPNGLTLRLEGDIVSLPYLLMTKKLMTYFGAKVDFEEKTFSIQARSYKARSFQVEGDWSAASYYYSIVAFEKIGYQIKLKGLQEDSVQGDQAIVKIAETFGVETIYNPDGISIKKVHNAIAHNFDFDFILCPDLAQSVSVMMAGLGINGKLIGLQTLRIKETNRILALQKELDKVNVEIEDDRQVGIMVQKGKAELFKTPLFETYEDHRMAMSLACLAVFGHIEIHHPDVVEKSYPKFWNDLSSIGFEINAIS